MTHGVALQCGLKRKTKTHARVTFHLFCRDAPTWAIDMHFGMRSDIADIITHVKFCVNRFRAIGVFAPSILSFSIGLAGGPYVNVSAIPCYIVTGFYSAPQCSHCKRCTSYSNSVRLSVCPSIRPSVSPSVCYTPVLCQNDCK